MEGTTWGVVAELGLVAQPDEMSNGIVMYGSADPAPNPAELILTQLTASQLGLPWRFFIYIHGRNLVLSDSYSRPIPRWVSPLEELIPEVSLRQLAEDVWRLRQEPAVVAHRPDGRPIRATSKTKDIPDITLSRLHQMGGWLGGSGIHYLLRKYAEKHHEVLYICPFQTKGRVYEIYRGFGRELFVLTPFVRFSPRFAPQGWEPITWYEWLSLPAAARRRARRWIKQELKNFFCRGEPRRIEVPWGWWSLR